MSYEGTSPSVGDAVKLKVIGIVGDAIERKATVVRVEPGVGFAIVFALDDDEWE